MTTPAEYAAADAAVLALVQAEIAQEVPAMFKNVVPAGLPEQFAAAASKAAVDAAAAARGD